MLTSNTRRPQWRQGTGRRSASRLALVILLVLAGALALAGPAQATIYGGTNCDQQPDAASCTTTAGATGSQGRAVKGHQGCRNAYGSSVPCSMPGKGWYSGGCYWQAATAALIPGPATSGSRWFAGTCGDPVIGFADEFAFLRQFQTAPGPETVAQQAIAMLRLPSPVIGMSPAPDAPQVVRVPAWLWVASGTWGQRSATATTGGVSVTATARPVSVAWSTGDGGQLTCEGPGLAWSSRFDSAAASPACGHTYLQPSPSSGFPVRATVRWSVSWAGAGMTGTAGPLTSTAVTAVRVLQSSAVNTTSGGGGPGDPR